MHYAGRTGAESVFSAEKAPPKIHASRWCRQGCGIARQPDRSLLRRRPSHFRRWMKTASHTSSTTPWRTMPRQLLCHWPAVSVTRSCAQRSPATELACGGLWAGGEPLNIDIGNANTKKLIDWWTQEPEDAPDIKLDVSKCGTSGASALGACRAHGGHMHVPPFFPPAVHLHVLGQRAMSSACASLY